MKAFLRHAVRRLREGMLREVLTEMKWIYRCSMRYKGAVIWYIFLGVFGTGMGLGSSVVSKYIIDAVTGYDSGLIVPAAVGYVSMNLFRIGANALTSRVSAKIQIGVNQEIRSEVFATVLHAGWEEIAEFHSGDLLNRLTGDVNTVSQSVLGWIPNLITGLVQFFSALFLILYYDATLAVLALLSAPVTLFLSKYLMKRMRDYNVKMREVSSDVMAFNEEAFQNLQYIKSFGLVGSFLERFRTYQEKEKDVRLTYNKFSIGVSSLMSVVGMAVSAVCFGWGVYRLWSGAITYGTMTLFLQMAGSLSAAFSSLINIVPSSLAAATAAGRIMEITKAEPEQADDPPGAEGFCRAAERSGAAVRMENVRFTYRSGRDVLAGASLFARPGEIVALVGPSGEGKTTVLRLLLGLVRPQAGRVTLEAGGETREMSARLRRLFAYVPQGNTMLSGTIAENLRLIRENATESELWDALEKACAAGFVRALPLGLETPLKERGGGLSEGQLQRLSIARALLCDAPVLLLDEATSALDLETERRLLHSIMRAESRRTCIVTTHRPGVLSACDRVYRVGDSGVELLGPEELKTFVTGK